MPASPIHLHFFARSSAGREPALALTCAKRRLLSERPRPKVISHRRPIQRKYKDIRPRRSHRPDFREIYIFSPRIACNFITTDLLGSMECAASVAGSKLILVLGHSECGAVKGACDSVEVGNLTSTLANILERSTLLSGLAGWLRKVI
ncbi:hypothetical protein EYC98_07350 [Halieaceae bacterium IMCC14734]|uniref:Carbonic anhydrase n=1 Tax=Candidatus Litorirhabdus singularis TaxID=2518993 RepID=A0ABT3TEF4_9GAMM|nr:carbonic anhydrase [Candidatus Litorirhabdus singularis]MCX2980692.1 hypothetical protein [Candidatus Litorirhabdus singularis]